MKTKSHIYLLVLLLLSSNIFCQIKTDSVNVIAPKIIKLIASTPLKDQRFTGTCWAHATTSFIETEAIRLGKKPVIISPMFYVMLAYIDKAEKFIRMSGIGLVDEGDLTFSVLNGYRDFGAVPEAIYSGNLARLSKQELIDFDNYIYKKARFYVDSCYGNMTRDGYRKDFKNILEKTMGKIPEKFLYEGKEYTPMSFANDMIGINPDEYIEITSFNHHPFYTKFILETVANWNNGYYLNLPIEDFIKVVNNSLQNNYSVCWDGDVSDSGFNKINCSATLTGKYQNVKIITQQMRQEAFDNYTTKDDHNMHIIGIAENDMGERFYVIKNSHIPCGYIYMSREYLLLRTISVMVHKNAIPEDIKDKCINID